MHKVSVPLISFVIYTMLFSCTTNKRTAKIGREKRSMTLQFFQSRDCAYQLYRCLIWATFLYFVFNKIYEELKQMNVCLPDMQSNGLPHSISMMFGFWLNYDERFSGRLIVSQLAQLFVYNISIFKIENRLKHIFVMLSTWFWGGGVCAVVDCYLHIKLPHIL